MTGEKKGRKLATYVYINGASYGPDDEVPEEVAAQITNPKAWVDEPESKGSDSKSGSAKS